LSDLKDVIDVVAPFESMARKTENAFVGAHYPQIDVMTRVVESDSPLRRALKSHIRKELSVVRVLQLIKKTKRLVAYMKTSGMNDKLEGGSLKQEVETRWMSVLHMIKSFFPTKSSTVTAEAKFLQVQYILLRGILRANL
jgi:hypothetical protein